MKLTGSFGGALFFLLLGVFGIVQSVAFEFWESMFLPLSLSVVIFILATVQVFKELHRPSTCTEEASRTDKPDDLRERIESRKLVVVLGWGAGFCLAIYLFGFYISIPIFVFAFLKWRRRGWLIAAILAVALTAITYAIFNIGLKLPLYNGLIFEAL